MVTIAGPAASTVTGVSVSQSTVSVNTSVTITVTGGNPCGAVQINFNDGNAPYLPIEGLPYQTSPAHFRMELDYLISQGFKLSADGMRMIK